MIKKMMFAAVLVGAACSAQAAELPKTPTQRAAADRTRQLFEEKSGFWVEACRYVPETPRNGYYVYDTFCDWFMAPLRGKSGR